MIKYVYKYPPGQDLNSNGIVLYTRYRGQYYIDIGIDVDMDMDMDIEVDLDDELRLTLPQRTLLNLAMYLWLTHSLRRVSY
jgi:hypothetical protein